MGTEMLNNKYPENIKHEVREHVSVCYQQVGLTSGLGALGVGLG